MRQHKAAAADSAFSILALDDDPIMTSTIQAYFQRSGYRVDIENDPMCAIERIRSVHYDILLLDFLMTPLCGDQVVEEIRKFDHELFIILLTGHKNMAPPIKTIRALDIQGYYEKSDRFDQLELLVESCVKSIRQLRTIRRYQEGLSSMMEFLPGIYHLQSVERIGKEILRAAEPVLHCVGSALILDGALCGTASSSRFSVYHAGTDIPVPEADDLGQLRQLLTRSDVRQAVCPIMDGLRTTGLLCVRWENEPSGDLLQLLEVFTRQASAALSNTLLHAIVQGKNRELDAAYHHLSDSYAEMIAAVRGFVDAKDDYTRNHSDRVSFYAVELAKNIGLDAVACDRIRVASLFHDIGKIGIPDSILLKDGRLTNEEYAVIKTHSARGAELLSQISHFHDIIPWVRAHHERYDGTGYPDGLSGESIPFEARIIAIADAFDAMTSDRRYRRGMSSEAATEELLREAGRQFDPAMVNVFTELAKAPRFLERAAQASRSFQREKEFSV